MAREKEKNRQLCGDDGIDDVIESSIAYIMKEKRQNQQSVLYELYHIC